MDICPQDDGDEATWLVAARGGDPGAFVRTARGVSDSISWQAVQTRTRTRPTVTTFGWRGKLALCCPPFAVIGFWAYAGAFNFGVIAVAFGIPMLWAALWWVKQVWVAGRELVDVSRDVPDPASVVDTSEEGRRRPPHQGLLYLYER